MRSTLNKFDMSGETELGCVPVKWARSLYGEVQCINGNGHMGTDRQTLTENITFPQLG